MSSSAFARLPPPKNEPMVLPYKSYITISVLLSYQLEYAPKSQERRKLLEALEQLYSEMPIKVPLIINGQRRYANKLEECGVQRVCAQHSKVACHYAQADGEVMQEAIEGALKAKEAWESMAFYDRAAIFLKAADLLTQKYRYSKYSFLHNLI